MGATYYQVLKSNLETLVVSVDMGFLKDVSLKYMKNEHKHSTQILDMTAHLRLSAEKRKAPLQDLREQSFRAKYLQL